MAYYRNVAISFWTDSKVVDDFTPEDKYFYLYLFTNPHTNLSGCYELSFTQASNELGYTKETVERLVKRFIQVHRVIDYCYVNKEILLINWCRYNWTSSEKFRKPLKKEIDGVKNAHFKRYLEDLFDSEDTVSIRYQYRSDTTVTVTVTDTVSDTVSDSSLKSQDSLNLKEDRKPKKRAKKEPVRKEVYFPLDDKLNQTFKDYVEMREKMGAKKAFQSIKAIDAAIDDLMEMANGDNDTAIKIIRKSLMNSWQGLFPLKDVSTAKQKTNYTGSIFENA